METLNNRNVFIVEDNSFYATLLKNELESFCNTITIFSSGEDCIENIDLKPDLILLDYNLSGKLSGIDVLRKVKEFNSNLPVVFISGNYKLEVVKNAISLGATDFFDKTDDGLSIIENKLRNIFETKTLAIEAQINKIAKKTTYLFFLLMFTSIVILFYLFPPAN